MEHPIPLNWLMLRTRTQEDSDCLLWTGNCSANGNAPTVTFRVNGRKPLFQVRRLVWQHKHGPIPDGLCVAVSCGNPKCLRHLELITKSEVVRRQWERTEFRAVLIAGVTHASRARSKINMEIARAIRSSNDTLEAVAKEYGISQSTASLIRRGERWRESASPFAGLGAR